MVELNSNVTSENTLLGMPAGTLNLRINGSPLHGQVIRVRAQKCSIGAAADCGIRLKSADARPVHCVLVRGRQGVLVRSWSRDTLLNGQTFQEAWLEPGDRLTLGSVEFDVLPSSFEAKSPVATPTASPITPHNRPENNRRFGRRDIPPQGAADATQRGGEEPLDTANRHARAGASGR